MANEPKTRASSIDLLQSMLEAEEGSALTILPDGTILIDEEKRVQVRAEVLTRHLSIGSNY